jgi:hypothetical protein
MIFAFALAVVAAIVLIVSVILALNEVAAALIPLTIRVSPM